MPPVQHAGYWESCKDADGAYAERVQEHWERGVFVYEMHLGPYDEFALYDHVVDGPEHTHAVADNLLGKSFRVSDDGTHRASREWTVPSLGLVVRVAQAGTGPERGCASYYVRIETREGL